MYFLHQKCKKCLLFCSFIRDLSYIWRIISEKNICFFTQFYMQKVILNHTLIFSIGPCNLIKYVFCTGYKQYEFKNLFKGRRHKNICDLYHIYHLFYSQTLRNMAHGRQMYIENFSQRIKIAVIFWVYIVRICKSVKRTTNILLLVFHPKISFFSLKFLFFFTKMFFFRLDRKNCKYAVLLRAFMENYLFL